MGKGIHPDNKEIKDKLFGICLGSLIFGIFELNTQQNFYEISNRHRRRRN